MRWQRYAWTVTLLVIWVVSLMIVDSAARQTRSGYNKQQVLKEQMELTEKNLRLQCEVSSLHDLEKAEKYSENENLEKPDPGQIDSTSITSETQSE